MQRGTMNRRPVLDRALWDQAQSVFPVSLSFYRASVPIC